MKTKVAIAMLLVSVVALVASLGYAAQKVTIAPTTGTTAVNLVCTQANADLDTHWTGAYCMNPSGEARTARIIATAVIPNYDSVGGGTGKGLQDTVTMSLQYKSRFGSWTWLTATAASDTAWGKPPCSLTISSTAALLINADSIRLAFRSFDSAGTAGGGSNDTLQRTVKFYIDNVTTYLLREEKHVR